MEIISLYQSGLWLGWAVAALMLFLVWRWFIERFGVLEGFMLGMIPAIVASIIFGFIGGIFWPFMIVLIPILIPKALERIRGRSAIRRS